MGTRIWWWLVWGALNLHPLALVAQGTLQEYREVHLGMEVRIALVSDADDAADAARRTYDQIDSLAAILSDWNPHSELRRLEMRPVGEWVSVSASLAEVLALALQVAEATDGAFDPTVGPLTRVWREVARTGVLASDSVVTAARRRVGFRQVELDTVRRRIRLHRDGVQFDLGAIAKGWILDVAIEKLREDGISAALIEAGGDLVVHGAPPGELGWRIAVADTTLMRSAGAVSTSGPSVQSLPGADGRRESHVMDVTSGRGVTNGFEMVVIGPHAAITDALATALTLVPPARRQPLAHQFGVAYREYRPSR